MELRALPSKRLLERAIAEEMEEFGRLYPDPPTVLLLTPRLAQVLQAARYRGMEVRVRDRSNWVLTPLSFLVIRELTVADLYPARRRREG